MSNVAFVKRFLTNIPGGKKLFDENKDKIVAEQLNTEDKVTSFFKSLLPKLKKRLDTGATSQSFKEEPFVFPVRAERNEDMPEWARDLKEEVDNIRSRMQSDESGFGEDDLFSPVDNRQVFAFSRNAKDKRWNSNQSKACRVCGKMGHWQKTCFKRICSNCNGTGHDANMCPSRKQGQSASKSHSTSKPSHKR